MKPLKWLIIVVASCLCCSFLSNPVQSTAVEVKPIPENSVNNTIYRIPLFINMRDKKRLAGDLYTENNTIAKPVILVQTPYNKQYYWTNINQKLPFSLDTYHIVVTDWRGRFASKQAGTTRLSLGKDGYDTVEWIANQPWCNGKIGTYGGSALGQVQFKTAAENPPHLVCAIPMVKDFRTTYASYYYGGEFRKEHVAALETLQFTKQETILEYPIYNARWKFVEEKTDLSSSIRIPMLLISGWFDHYPDLVLRAFADLQEKSHSTVRNSHKLIFGPWLHGGIGKLDQGCLQFPNAEGFAQRNAVQFMDFYLLDRPNQWDTKSTVQYYQMGEEKWYTAASWKQLPRTTSDLYLHPSLSLSPQKATEKLAFKEYKYNPKNPTPSFGGDRFQPGNKHLIEGPQDQRNTVESRTDVLVFTSEEYTDKFSINGSIKATLFIQSNCPDTDFSIRFCDVHPNGSSILLAEGIQRARFRNNLEIEELLNPSEIVPITVTLQNIAHTIMPGHSVRIIVSSASYPIFEKNPNNGGALYKDPQIQVAENRIYTCSTYPSKITFQTLRNK